MSKGEILIVEDEAFLQIYWEEVCQEVGVNVAAMVSTVHEALELVKTHHFAGVVLDVTLLDGSSESVAELLRKRLTPGLICTGDPHKLSPAYHHFPILEKPVTFDAMADALKNLIR